MQEERARRCKVTVEHVDFRLGACAEPRSLRRRCLFSGRAAARVRTPTDKSIRVTMPNQAAIRVSILTKAESVDCRAARLRHRPSRRPLRCLRVASQARNVAKSRNNPPAPVVDVAEMLATGCDSATGKQCASEKNAASRTVRPDEPTPSGQRSACAGIRRPSIGGRRMSASACASWHAWLKSPRRGGADCRPTSASHPTAEGERISGKAWNCFRLCCASVSTAPGAASRVLPQSQHAARGGQCYRSMANA